MGKGELMTSKVMLVDDDELIRDFVSETLSSHGLSVETFSNGADAVAHYRNRYRQIDGVILDVKMPNPHIS